MLNGIQTERSLFDSGLFTVLFRLTRNFTSDHLTLYSSKLKMNVIKI